MLIMFGTRLYGKTDHVPGLFYVATKFFHLNFLPLIPLGSVVVLDGTETGDGYQAVDIGLSGKSVLFAWARAGAVLGAIGAAFFGLFGAIESHPASAAGGLGAAAACLGGWWFSYSLSGPSPERARRLAEEARFPPDLLDALDAGHGRAGEVAPMPGENG